MNTNLIFVAVVVMVAAVVGVFVLLGDSEDNGIDASPPAGEVHENMDSTGSNQ